MALIVQKYGGTSVANPERIRNLARRVARYKAMGHQIVVVVSAMSGETNPVSYTHLDVYKRQTGRNGRFTHGPASTLDEPSFT